MRGTARGLVGAVCLAGLAACTAARHGRAPGASFPPQRVATAARNALTDGHTWIPALASLVFSVGDLDEDVSRSIGGAPRTRDASVRTSGLFGSRGTASTTSDVLLYGVSPLMALAPGLVTSPSAVWREQGPRFVATSLATWGVGTGWKELWGERRPNNEDDQSYPSGHAYMSSMWASMARINYRRAGGAASAAPLFDAATTGVAAMTAYARVEARQHYPSDVLMGYAFGNFMAIFGHDLCHDPRFRTHFFCMAEPSRGGVDVAVGLQADI